MPTYDLNEIAEAMATAVQGLDTDTYGGTVAKLTAYAEPPGQANAPAIAFELDDVAYDLTAGRGADAFVFLGYLIASEADSTSGQRLVRKMLSSGGAAERVKDAFEADTTLGGLVSYVHFSGTRSVGRITYSGVDYQGAVLVFQVVTQ